MWVDSFRCDSIKKGKKDDEHEEMACISADGGADAAGNVGVSE